MKIEFKFNDNQFFYITQFFNFFFKIFFYILYLRKYKLPFSILLFI